MSGRKERERSSEEGAEKRRPCSLAATSVPPKLVFAHTHATALCSLLSSFQLLLSCPASLSRDPLACCAIMTSHDYTTCIDGKGYRFTLPSLGLPDPQGEWVTIQAALTTNQVDTLDALNKVKDKTEGVLRSPSEDRVTIDVLHEEATWLLPILQPEGREETQAFMLKVRRLPARGGEHATAQNEELSARAASSLSLNDSLHPTNEPSAASSSGGSSSSESSYAPDPPSRPHDIPALPTVNPR